MTRSLLAEGRRVAVVFLLLALAAFPLAAQIPPAPSSAGANDDPVLMRNSVTEVRKSDFERELLRLPPNLRGGFYSQPKRMNELLLRVLATKTLAVQAKAEKLDQDPEIAARLALELERFEAQLKLQQIEKKAAADFDARRASFEARARELYLVDAKKYEQPEQVSASHILFDQGRHTSEEAQRLAREARERIRAGADFNEEAKRISEDPSAPMNAGHLDWFTRAEMEAPFADAAFALKSVGDVSEPVLTRFGWHIIRLDGRRAAGRRAYEEVKDSIMQDLRNAYIAEQRDAWIGKINADPAFTVNQQAIDAIVVRPDMEAVRRTLKEAAQQPGAGGRP